MKKCRTCKLNKADSDFYSHNRAWAQCKQCYRRKAATYRKKHPAYNKTYLKKWYAANKEKVRLNLLRKNYGITAEQWFAQLSKQKGACGMCRELPQPGDKMLYVDHDHVTGKLRGLVCNNCNRFLGWIEKRPETVTLATLYLEKYGSAALGIEPDAKAGIIYF